jgi:hypothetical protein
MKPTNITSITTAKKKKQAGSGHKKNSTANPPQSSPKPKRKPPQRKPQPPPLPSYLRKRYLNEDQVEAITGISKRTLASWRKWGVEHGPPFKRFGRNRACLYEERGLHDWIQGLPGGGDPTFHVRWALETLRDLPLETLDRITARDTDSLEVAIKARANLEALIAELEKYEGAKS